MRAIALNTRRMFLAFCAVRAFGAKNDPPTLKLLTDVAAKLSDSNYPGALDDFAQSMPGYGELSANLGALTAQYDVICVIEIRTESGDDAHRKAETEWFVQMKSKSDEGPTERRNAVVQIETGLVSGRWKITAMTPRSVLAPPQV